MLEYLYFGVFCVVCYYVVSLIKSLEMESTLDLSQKLDAQYRQAVQRAVAYSTGQKNSIDVAVKYLISDIHGTVLNMAPKDYEYDVLCELKSREG